MQQFSPPLQRSKTDYIDGTELQLDMWEDQFGDLERRLQRDPRPERPRIERKLDHLRRQKRALKRRLRQAAHASTGSRDWAETRRPIERAVDDFRTLAAEVYDEVRRTSS